MISFLKAKKQKKLLTINKVVSSIKKLTIEEVTNYVTYLSQEPKRSDFIPYDTNGDFIKDHKPKFKNWTICNEASDAKSKVAKLQNQFGDFRIYFNTIEGVVIVSKTNVVDRVKYNDLAIFFESELDLY